MYETPQDQMKGIGTKIILEQ